MNPLLDIKDLPDFSRIKPEHLAPAIDALLQEYRHKLTNVLQIKEFTWEDFVEPLELMEEKLAIVWSTATHLHAVQMDIWREVYQENLEKLINHQTEIAQNETLYQAYEFVAHAPAFSHYNAAQKKVIKNILRGFRLSGVHLSTAKKQQYAKLQQELGKLTTQFEENLADATQAW